MPTVLVRDDKVIRKKYICTQCGAEDEVKLFPTERTPAAINCWKCRAGLKVELPMMMQTMTGMFPAEVIESWQK